MTLLVHQGFGPPDAMHYEKFYCIHVTSPLPNTQLVSLNLSASEARHPHPSP